MQLKLRGKRNRCEHYHGRMCKTSRVTGDNRVNPCYQSTGNLQVIFKIITRQSDSILQSSSIE